MKQPELTDEQWGVIAPLMVNQSSGSTRRGRPSRDPHEVLNGILWVLRYDARWQDLPERFPSHQTCHRRFQQWMRDGTLRIVLEALEKDLRERGGFEATEWLNNYRAVAANDDEHEHNRSNGSSSWQQRTAMLFLSPATLRLLHRVGSPLARRLSLRYLPYAKCLVGACSIWAVLGAAESLSLTNINEMGALRHF
jgi:transposase